MADAEWTFGTICQRFLAGLGARMHYGPLGARKQTRRGEGAVWGGGRRRDMVSPNRERKDQRKGSTWSYGHRDRDSRYRFMQERHDRHMLACSIAGRTVWQPFGRSVGLAAREWSALQSLQAAEYTGPEGQTIVVLGLLWPSESSHRAHSDIGFQLHSVPTLRRKAMERHGERSKDLKVF